jgi:hypothetical protein
MNHLTVLASCLLMLSSISALPQSGNEIDLEAIKEKIKEHINLDDIKSKLPPGVELPDLDKLGDAAKTIEDTQKVLREKCIKVSGSDAAFEEAQEAVAELTQCVQGLVNVTVIQEEIEKATPNGELETVFNKYCKKRNTAIDCVANFTNSIDPCLEPQERESKKTIVDIATSLVNFVCHKDGDQIALFIAEKGPECLQEKKDIIMDCINSTFRGYVPDEAPKTIDELPVWSFGEKECNDLETLKQCVVKELEKCEESTPANLVDAMFRFVRNKTPCVNFTQQAQRSHNEETAAAATHLASFFLLMSTAFVLAANYL